MTSTTGYRVDLLINGVWRSGDATPFRSSRDAWRYIGECIEDAYGDDAIVPDSAWDDFRVVPV